MRILQRNLKRTYLIV